MTAPGVPHDYRVICRVRLTVERISIPMIERVLFVRCKAYAA
jgi:hypothetical protein